MQVQLSTNSWLACSGALGARALDGVSELAYSAPDLARVHRGEAELDAVARHPPAVEAPQRDHLDVYGHMMHRVMQQHRTRMHAIRSGYVTWTELETATVAPGLRPEENRPLMPPPLRPPPLRPRTASKALSPSAKSVLAIGGGASAAGLVWWLWKRFLRRTR